MTEKKKRFGCLKTLAILVVLGVVAVVAITVKMTRDMEAEATYVVGSVLNVRNGPGTDHAVVAQLNRGQMFTVVADSLGWLLIDPWSGEIEGEVWIYAELTGSKDDVEAARRKDSERARAVASSASSPSSKSRQVSAGGTTTITGDRWFGCVVRQDFERIVGYAVQGDDEAFSSALALELMAGTGYVFNRGESVYVTDTALLSGLIKVRPRGQTLEYWTNVEAIH